jgi:hypothetical protein
LKAAISTLVPKPENFIAISISNLSISTKARIGRTIGAPTLRVLDDSGELWTFKNPDVRVQDNITVDRRTVEQPVHNRSLPNEHPN